MLGALALASGTLRGLGFRDLGFRGLGFLPIKVNHMEGKIQNEMESADTHWYRVSTNWECWTSNGKSNGKWNWD